MKNIYLKSWSKQRKAGKLVTTFCEEVNLSDDLIDATDDVRDAPENGEDDLNDDILLIAKE